MQTTVKTGDGRYGVLTGRTFRFAGIEIPEIITEPCYRASQLMKREPMMCKCRACRERTPNEGNSQ